MNTTPLIEQWSMDGARRDLERHSGSGSDIRALLLGADRQVQVAPLPGLVEDPHPAVLFKDPREVGWHFLEDA